MGSAEGALECGSLLPLSPGRLAGRAPDRAVYADASMLAEESGSKLPHSKAALPMQDLLSAKMRFDQ